MAIRLLTEIEGSSPKFDKGQSWPGVIGQHSFVMHTVDSHQQREGAHQRRIGGRAFSLRLESPKEMRITNQRHLTDLATVLTNNVQTRPV